MISFLNDNIDMGIKCNITRILEMAYGRTEAKIPTIMFNLIMSTRYYNVIFQKIRETTRLN